VCVDAEVLTAAKPISVWPQLSATCTASAVGAETAAARRSRRRRSSAPSRRSPAGHQREAGADLEAVPHQRADQLVERVVAPDSSRAQTIDPSSPHQTAPCAAPVRRCSGWASARPSQARTSAAGRCAAAPGQVGQRPQHLVELSVPQMPQPVRPASVPPVLLEQREGGRRDLDRQRDAGGAVAPRRRSTATAGRCLR